MIGMFGISRMCGYSSYSKYFLYPLNIYTLLNFGRKGVFNNNFTIISTIVNSYKFINISYYTIQHLIQNIYKIKVFLILGNIIKTTYNTLNTNIYIKRISQATSTSKTHINTVQQINQTIQTLHKKIIKIQTQINQLTLENQLLKVQADSKRLKINNLKKYKDDKYYIKIFLL